MSKIELSYPAVMSLTVNSSTGSEEEEVEEIEEVESEDSSALEMSDEEFEKMSESDFTESENEEDDNESLGDDKNEDLKSEANVDEPPESADDDGSEQADDEDDTNNDQPNDQSKEVPPGPDEKQIADAFELLYGSPIKASGREVKLRNPEHAKNFIEMGIDYNKKMQSMKPHLAALKTLEKQGLLGNDKIERLNLLFEVEKGNKDALKRLIAESDIDPLDFADENVIEEGKNYQPENHIMSPRQIELDEALDSIEGTEAQQRTLNVMTNEMDERSRMIISENPSFITNLNNDISSGIYDRVMEGVNYKRDMKMVPNEMSDMELYIETVKEMAQYEQSQQPAQQEQVAPGSAPKQEQKKSNRRKKLGMSGSRSSKSTNKKEYDPMEILGMDDEKFMREMGMDNL